MEKKDKVKTGGVTLMAVGDIMLGEMLLSLGHGVGTLVKERGPLFPFLKVAPTLSQGDIVFGNLECVLSQEGKNPKSARSLQLRGEPAALDGLLHAGFNVLSLANNHILEHGEEALWETVSLLSRHRIQCLGVPRDLSRLHEPTIADFKDIAIALLAYNLIPDDTAYHWLSDPQIICQAVKKAKTQADVVVVSLHWGEEYIDTPAPSQIRLARTIIDSGANLILGSHTHTLQGIENYKGGVIAYSLGNFLFDMPDPQTKKSAILRCRLSKRGVEEVDTLPIYINDHFQPEILQGEDAQRLRALIKQLSSALEKEDLSQQESKEKVYLRQAALQRKQHRSFVRRYFLKNLLRYPPRFVWQIVIDFFYRQWSSRK